MGFKTLGFTVLTFAMNFNPAMLRLFSARSLSIRKAKPVMGTYRRISTDGGLNRKVPWATFIFLTMALFVGHHDLRYPRYAIEGGFDRSEDDALRATIEGSLEPSCDVSVARSVFRNWTDAKRI